MYVRVLICTTYVRMWHICMNIYVCVHSVYMYFCAHVRMYVGALVCMYSANTYVLCKYVGIYVRLCVYMCACTRVCMYVCTILYNYLVGSKSFRPDQLFKATEIKQLCYFST